MVHAPRRRDDCRKSRGDASAVTADVRTLADAATETPVVTPARAAGGARPDAAQRPRAPDLDCSMVPVQRFEPQRQPHSFFSFAVCGSSSTMP